MLLRTTKIISFSILLSFTILFSSCTLMTIMLEPFIAQLKSKVNYEEKEVFNLEQLGYQNRMYSNVKSIDSDDNYIYCITSDDTYYNTRHGIFIRAKRDGSEIKSFELCAAVRNAGFTECYAYNLKTVDVYDDKIIICGESSVMFPIYTELICLDKNTLEVLWHWHSKQYGWNEHSSTARWNGKYIFQYGDSSPKTAWLTILDENGKELVTKRIGSCGWSDAGEPVISGDTLIVRTVSHSYEAYDLNLLLDPSLTSEDCLISCSDTSDSYYSVTGITADGCSFYTHTTYMNDDIKQWEGFIDCRDIKSCELRWRTLLDGTFGFVNGIPTVHGDKVYVPADYGSLYCLDAKTGEKIWHTDIRTEQNDANFVNLMKKPCIVSDRWLCVTNSSKELLVVDIRNGDIMARIKSNITTSIIQCFPEGDYLYLAGADSLYRFRFWEK